jgi:purine-binding chemotaxis protein CheW
MTLPISYATFYLADFYFGIPSASVVELTNTLMITPVPLAPSAISGLINLRGKIVTAIDLRKRLGITSRPELEGSVTVFVNRNELLFGLIIDRVCDILELDSSDFQQPPHHVSEDIAELIVGFHKLPDKLMFILDLDKLIYGCIASNADIAKE